MKKLFIIAVFFSITSPAMADCSNDINCIVIDSIETDIIAPVNPEIAQFPSKNTFANAGFPQNPFIGETDAVLFKYPCSIAMQKGVDKNGETAVIFRFENKNYILLKSFGISSAFFDNGRETSFVTNNYPSRENPRIAVRFDSAAYQRENKLIPVEYKIIIELGNHYFGHDKLLYQCNNLRPL